MQGGQRELTFELVTEAACERAPAQEQQRQLLESEAMNDYLEAHCATEEERKMWKANFFKTQLDMRAEEYNENVSTRDGARIITNHEEEAMARLTLTEVEVTDENKTQYTDRLMMHCFFWSA